MDRHHTALCEKRDLLRRAHLVRYCARGVRGRTKHERLTPEMLGTSRSARRKTDVEKFYDSIAVRNACWGQGLSKKLIFDRFVSCFQYRRRGTLLDELLISLKVRTRTQQNLPCKIRIKPFRYTPTRHTHSLTAVTASSFARDVSRSYYEHTYPLSGLALLQSFEVQRTFNFYSAPSTSTPSCCVLGCAWVKCTFHRSTQVYKTLEHSRQV